MSTSFDSKSKNTSIKTCKAKKCTQCGTQQNSNVVKVCRNKECQHIFIFKNKKISRQGCTTKTCLECGKHAKSNRSVRCIDPECHYVFPSGQKVKMKKNKISKKVKSKIGHKRKNTVVFTESFYKALDLFGAENNVGMSMDSFGDTFGVVPLIERKSSIDLLAPLIQRKSSIDLLAPLIQRKSSIDLLAPLIQRKSSIDLLAPLIQRKSSLDLFGMTPLIERESGGETWYGYMQDNIDDVHIESSEEDDDWIQTICNEI